MKWFKKEAEEKTYDIVHVDGHISFSDSNWVMTDEEIKKKTEDFVNKNNMLIAAYVGSGSSILIWKRK